MTDRTPLTERPYQHWTPNELVRAVERAIPIEASYRKSARKAVEELRVRAVVAPDENALDVLRRGVGALVATARCYKRPNSKLEPDPGPCGKCAACLARLAYYGSTE